MGISSIKEESLREALSATACSELPKRLSSNETRFWIEAIILVKKANMTTSYTTAKRRGDGSIVYTGDYGMMSPIMGIVSIHPYLYLSKAFLPKGGEKEIRAFFVGNAKEDEERENIKKMSAQELWVMAIDYAIQQQKNAGEADIYLDEIEQLENEKEEAEQQK